MNRWVTNDHDRLCGGCGRHIRIGEPVRLFYLPGIDEPKARCRQLECADGEVPPDLPPLVTREAIAPMVRLGSVKGGLPLDFKAAAAGREREPGEDDE